MSTTSDLLVYIFVMYKDIFAKNLKDLIGKKSIRQVAKELNIPERTLGRYVNAEQEIGLDYLIKIADHFKESLDVLTGRKDY